MHPTNAKEVIIACAILHNISKDLRQPEVRFQLPDNDVDDVIPDIPNGVNGKAVRAQIVANFFEWIQCIL